MSTRCLDSLSLERPLWLVILAQLNLAMIYLRGNRRAEGFVLRSSARQGRPVLFGCLSLHKRTGSPRSRHRMARESPKLAVTRRRPSCNTDSKQPRWPPRHRVRYAASSSANTEVHSLLRPGKSVLASAFSLCRSFIPRALRTHCYTRNVLTMIRGVRLLLQLCLLLPPLGLPLLWLRLLLCKE